MNDIFQVNYLPEKREIRINLPEEVWKNIDTVIMTRLFQEELVVEGYCKIAEKRISETTSNQIEGQLDWFDELLGVSK